MLDRKFHLIYGISSGGSLRLSSGMLDSDLQDTIRYGFVVKFILRDGGKGFAEMMLRTHSLPIEGQILDLEAFFYRVDQVVHRSVKPMTLSDESRLIPTVIATAIEPKQAGQDVVRLVRSSEFYEGE